MRVALAGNPNSGKTSLFNELTGSNQYVGNWAGVTVERKAGHLRDHAEVEVVDLPGIYSLSPYTPEEVVARRYLLEEKPDLVVNVVDATNLERNLYLTSQLLETDLPMVVALNMTDLLERRCLRIKPEALAEALGCPVLEVSALHRKGLRELREMIAGNSVVKPGKPLPFPPAVERALQSIIAEHTCTRWEAVKLLENDLALIPEHSHHICHLLDHLRDAVEAELGDDIASIIAGGRYDAIMDIIPQAVERTGKPSAFSAKIDRVATHRVFGIGIFALVMWCIYYLSINTVGKWGTDWASDVVFGPVVLGWLRGFIGSAPLQLESMVMFSSILAMCLVFPTTLRRLHDLGRGGSWLYLAVAPFLLEYMCPHLPEPLHTGIQWVLYAVNAGLMLYCMLRRGNTGANRYGAEPRGIKPNAMSLNGRATRKEYMIRLATMSAIAFGIGLLGRLQMDCSPQLVAVVTDGIVAGVGAVLGFLPQMAVLFLLLALLEDCGYMARVAFMMDRIFRTIGLSGKSFIPLMVAMGCGVPGIMASRTIENDKDRRMTVMLTTFIPCSAKLPLITLFGAVLGQDATIATLAYFAGIGSVILGGLMLRKSHMFAGGYTPFVMELPPYHRPSGGSINTRAMERCRAFVKKAGTIIFLASAFIWFASNYSWDMDFLDTAHDKPAVEQSMLADAGRNIAPVFTPLGWGDWKPTVATISGLVAKENVVSTLGVLYGSAKDDGETMLPRTSDLPRLNAFTAPTIALWHWWLHHHPHMDTPTVPAPQAAPAANDGEQETNGIARSVRSAGLFGTWGAALSFMLFNLLCAPCVAACAAIRREMRSSRWTMLAVGFMTAWAYMVSFLVNQLGKWAELGVFRSGQFFACLLAGGLVYLIFRPNRYREEYNKERHHE